MATQMNVLYENQNIKIKELETYIKNTKSLHPYFEINFNGIKPKNYCGFLSIESQSYFIAPKITNEASTNLNIFIYMLIYAYDIKLSHEDLIDAHTHEHRIFEIFIKLFADELLTEFKKGVFKKYVTLEENLKTLRGRYMIEKNFTNFHHQNIYCEFDEFSMDNELNRFFLFAIRVFKKYSNYPNLSRCEMILDEVEYLNIDFNRLNIYFDRMSSRYQKSYRVALMILNRLVPMPDKSDGQSFAFLFDMAEVFEKFVGKLYKEIDNSTQLQLQKNFGSLHLKPDIVTANKIIDTKYKKVKDRGDLSTQDKYQMFVYGVNFDIGETMLLYPKHLVDIDDSLELGKGDDLVRLEMRSLDFGFDGGFNEFIGEIRDRLEGINV